MTTTETRWLNAEALAAYLSVRVDRLSRLVREGKLPPADYTLGSRSPRWDKNQIDEWMADGKIRVFGMVPDVDIASRAYAERLRREAREKRAYQALDKAGRH